MKTDVLQTLWESSVLVKLLYSYSSTKDKLLLNYFIRKHFQLLMATFGISKELIVTLKYHYGKKYKPSRNHVKISLLFKVP